MYRYICISCHKRNQTNFHVVVCPHAYAYVTLFPIVSLKFFLRKVKNIKL